MTTEDNTPKTELDAKIAFARQKLQEFRDACQDPEVRNAICDQFWDDDDPECGDSTAESVLDNYGKDERAIVLCSVSMDKFVISGGGEDDDGNELPYKYENV